MAVSFVSIGLQFWFGRLVLIFVLVYTQMVVHAYIWLHLRYCNSATGFVADWSVMCRHEVSVRQHNTLNDYINTGWWLDGGFVKATLPACIPSLCDALYRVEIRAPHHACQMGPVSPLNSRKSTRISPHLLICTFWSICGSIFLPAQYWNPKSQAWARKQ